MSEENDSHCPTCYCEDKGFLLRSMKSDHQLIKVIEKALWAIEGNNIVRMAEMEWQIKQEKENEDS